MSATATPVNHEAKAAPPPVMPEPKSAARKNWPALLLESVIALVVVVSLVECLFALAGIGEQEYLRVDPVLGFVPMEGKHVTWRKEGNGHIQFNSQGRNDIERPFAKPADTYRIAMVGDSFVEALQVDRHLNFCTLLEKQLNEKYGSAKKHFEVINFGCSANSLGQFYKKLNTQVFAYHPDVVMVNISVDATKLLAPIQGGFAFANARPTFTVDKDGKLVEDWQIFRWWNSTPDGKRFAKTAFLRQYSHIWGAIGVLMGSYQAWYQDLLAGKVWGWGAPVQPAAPVTAAAKKPLPAPGSYSAVNSSCGGSTGRVDGQPVAASPREKIALPQAQGDVEGDTRKYWPVAEKLITAMETDCRAHQARFAVVHLPARPEIGFDNPLETSYLQQLCTRLAVPYVDLTDEFINAPKQVALIYSVHMTPDGHKLATREYFKFIEKNKLQGE
ncbi:MAG: SGNH/GDSL hydrolase family protein [Cyanobacteria bacterium SZAS LIN-3]|nr:SGNH/GDSL hydrolase family protein [Cyanobacteria bacterium SZAS LIN-3]